MIFLGKNLFSTPNPLWPKVISIILIRCTNETITRCKIHVRNLSK